MQYIVAVAAVCPMRSGASHKSEMVSQLLLGETGEVIEAKGDFTKVRCLYDGYEGWCANSQLAVIDDVDNVTPLFYVTRRNTGALVNGINTPVSLASPVFSKAIAGNYVIEFEEGFVTNSNVPAGDREAFIKQLTWQYINTPYLWGGKSSFGIDCSGFTQQVFKIMGKPLLRDAYQQATQGETINALSESICGDLAFFDNNEGRITHVGILLDNKTIIHASGYVRVDAIDVQGITHSVTGIPTHKLKLIKRLSA
jgi:hypothetical protein